MKIVRPIIGKMGTRMATPAFTFEVDETRHLITMRLFGREDSAYYADQIIAMYRSVPDIWRYNRLVDHRKFRGMIVLDDLRRVSQAWRELAADREPRVAFLTRSALTRSRISAHSEVFSGQHPKVFTNLTDAMVWVSENETIV